MVSKPELLILHKMNNASFKKYTFETKGNAVSIIWKGFNSFSPHLNGVLHTLGRPNKHVSFVYTDALKVLFQQIPSACHHFSEIDLL